MTDDAARITFVGHATTVIETGGATVVTDPVLRSRVWFLRSTAAVDRIEPLRPDVVLLSHLHHDHCDLPSLARAGRDACVVAPVGASRLLRRAGVVDAVELEPGESCTVGRVAVTATYAEHDGRRWPVGSARPALGFVVSSADIRVYFAGDTDLFAAMGDLGRPDVALLPVWGWGRSLGPGHLDPLRAAEAVRLIRPQVVVPIHWGTLRPAWHRWRSDDVTAPVRRFTEQLHRGHVDTTAVVLHPGQSLSWPVRVNATGQSG